VGLCAPRYFLRPPANHGSRLVCPCLCKGLIDSLSLLGANYVLKSWAQHNQEAGRNAETGKYLTLYGLAIAVSGLLSFFSALILWVWCGIRSAQYLHDRVLAALLRSPLSFFDTTPSGRYAIGMHLVISSPNPSIVSSMSSREMSTSSTKSSLVSSPEPSGPGLVLWERWQSSVSASRSLLLL
jgi:ABC-type multidrug transport system fused ATPase/permease subunit